MLRDNLVGLIEPMLSSAGANPLALCTARKEPSDDRPPCLENPRPKGAEPTLTENVPSPFHAEPRQCSSSSPRHHALRQEPVLCRSDTSTLFALITDNDFYAINVYSHRDFEMISVVESLHRNWPQAIKQYRVNGIPGEILSPKQRRNIRNANEQIAVTVSDGTAYMAIGGGVTPTGVSVRAVHNADRMRDSVRRFQTEMQEQLERFIIHLRPRGYVDAQEVKANLVGLTPKAYQVLFPEYGVRATVPIEDGLQTTSPP